MISVDVGGTFTDVVAMEAGKVRVKKVPTTPDAREKGVLEGLSILGVNDKKIFNHASTAGINAILTRDLPKIGFLTTFGHHDILDMGRGWRPWDAQTDPHWRRSFGDAMRPLVPRYLRRGIRQRTLGSGEVMLDLDVAQAKEELEILKRQGIEGVAICLINAYANGEPERQLRDLAKEVLGDVAVSISSEVSPLAKEFTRASTTVIDTFMKLIFRKYIDGLIQGAEKLGFRGSTNLADCAAMLIPWEFSMLKPFRNIYSGPAAGTVSSAYFGNLIDEDHLICCDIGGTSCDISLVRGGRPTVRTEFEIEPDLVVNTLANEIFTIGAGGGSIVHVSPTGQLTVGPDSVGADPGPACYGKGGKTLTVTDLCLLIGILDAGEFLGGEMAIHPELAEQAVKRLDIKLTDDEKVRYSYALTLYNISEGIVDVCVSLGVDPREYSLVAYGSAGPMLLPPLMEELRVKRVIVPPHPGAFSALGLLSSDLVFTNERTAYTILTPDKAEAIDMVYQELEEEMFRQIGKREGMEVERTFDGMYAGQTSTTSLIPVPPGKITAKTIEQMIGNYNDEYEKRAGNKFEYIPVMGVNYRCRIVSPLPKAEYQELPARTGGKPEVKRKRVLSYLKNAKGSEIEVAEFEREELMRGDTIEGPAVIREPMSTTHILERQKATIGKYGEIRIEMR
jgi:N-methylhydantoinase A